MEVQMRENTVKKNSEYGYFSRSATPHCFIIREILLSRP